MTEPATPAVAPGNYRLDPPRTVIHADVQAMFGLLTVRGTFRLRSGEVTIADDAARSSVRAVIDAASFSSGNAIRDRDVVSAGMLDASAYPEITFAGDGPRPQGAGWLIPGTVTARGVTVPADLLMSDIRAEGGVIRFRAVTSLDRTRFGVTRKKGIVGQTIGLSIDAVAVPATPEGPDTVAVPATP
jgi:polyisoprenoid-binding protein YceI